MTAAMDRIEATVKKQDASVQTTQPEDQELILLIERAQDGCEQSIEALFNRYFFRVSSFVRRYVDAHEVEDVAQETLIKVFRNLGNIKKAQAFEGYLFQTAKNSCISWLRKKKRMRSMLDIVWHAATNWQNPSSDHEPQRAAAIDALMEQLPDVSQKYLHLFYVEKRSRAEIAAAMNESTSSAYRKLAGAKANLLEAAKRMNVKIVFTGRHDMSVQEIEAKL